jgi:D-proline reductase (dithiol) PrdB
MTVDSFKYLPRLIATFYQMTDREPEYPIPWTPLPGSLDNCTFGLVTSGGLYQRGVESPFDLQREVDEPTWGDPTYRTIPVDIRRSEVGVSHLHVNTQWVEEDINVLLPVDRFKDLAAEGVVGGLAPNAYSFMGYQGFPPNPAAWQETYGPQVAEKLKDEGVDCVLLTPS